MLTTNAASQGQCSGSSRLISAIEMSCHSLYGLIMQFHLTTDSSLLHISLSCFKITALCIQGAGTFTAASPFPGCSPLLRREQKTFSLTLNNPTLKLLDVEQERGNRQRISSAAPFLENFFLGFESEYEYFHQY